MTTQRNKDPRQLPVQLNVNVPWSFREFLIDQAKQEGLSLNKLVTRVLMAEFGTAVSTTGGDVHEARDQERRGHVVTVVNHNQRVLKALRDDGYHAQVVERYDSFTKRRHDLFGVIDILAVGWGITRAIQVTSRSNMSSRRTKIRESEAFKEMLKAGWHIELWGYDKPKNRWRLVTEQVTL